MCEETSNCGKQKEISNCEKPKDAKKKKKPRTKERMRENESKIKKKNDLQKIPEIIICDKIDDDVQKDVSHKAIKKSKDTNSFDKIRKKLMEIENELRSKVAEKGYQVAEVKKSVKSKRKSSKNVHQSDKAHQYPEMREIACCTEMPFIKMSRVVSKVPISAKQDKEISRDTDRRKLSNDRSLIPKAIQTPNRKTEKHKEAERSREKVSTCHGKCNRLKKIELRNNSKVPCGCSNTSNRNEHLLNGEIKNFLEELTSRIKITKEVLNSPDMRSARESLRSECCKTDTLKRSQVFTRKSPSEKRESGAGDKDINFERMDLFFSRRSAEDKIEDDAGFLKKNNKNIVSRFEKTSNEAFYLENSCYQKSSSQSCNDIVFDKNAEQLIVESFSEKEQ